MPVARSSGRQVVGETVVQLAVQAGQRFVEQQHRRRRCQRSSQRHPLRLAAAQRRDRSRLEALQPDETRAPRGHAGASRAARPATLGIRSPNSTLAATSRCGNSWLSWNTIPIDRRCVGVVGDVAPVEPDDARLRLQQPGDHPQQRALARAGRTLQRDDLASGRRAARRVEHDPIAEGDDDLDRVEHVHATSPTRASTVDQVAVDRLDRDQDASGSPRPASPPARCPAPAGCRRPGPAAGRSRSAASRRRCG